MKLRSELQKSATIDDLLEHEAAEHNLDYAGKTGFGSPTLKLTKEFVWAVNDHVYKKGTYKRGYIKRRMLESLDLHDIEGKLALDVGCGTGQHSVFMAMHGARTVGFDLSTEGLKVGRAMAEANDVSELCDFEVANISALPYPDNTFDIVLLNAVLHHVLKFPNVREETYRILKPGGKIVIVDALRDNPLYTLARAVKDKIKGTQSDLGDVDMQFKDYVQFSRDYENVKFEQRCLFEGAKEILARDYGSSFPIRCVLRLATEVDNLLLRLLPFTGKYCSEILGTMNKPMSARESN